MARKKVEFELLGSASKEELLKFKIAKKSDAGLDNSFSMTKAKTLNRNVVTEEEILKIKKRGEQEILQIQNELNDFKSYENRQMSYMTFEEEEEEEVQEKYTALERIKSILAYPFISLVDSIDNLSKEQKVYRVRSILLIFIVAVVVSMGVFSAKKFNIITATNITLNTQQCLGGVEAMPVEQLNFDDNYCVLRKVIFDDERTVFVFDEAINFTDKYNAEIIDDEDKSYYVDQYAMRILSDNYSGQVLVMQPLDDGVRSFELILEDKLNGDKYKFNFILSEFLDKPEYIQEYNVTNNYESGLNIDSFISSASGSVLNYSIDSSKTPYTYKIIDGVGMTSGVYEGMTILPSISNGTQVYDFPNQDLTLYQQAVSVPKTFDDEFKFKASDIFKSYDVNKSYTRNQIQNGVQINVGQYSLNIEDIRKSGDTAVLVYHCIDNDYVDNNDTEEDTYGAKEDVVATKPNYSVEEISTNNSNRVYAYLDLDIVIKDKDGNITQTISPTEFHIGDEGADILFTDDRLNDVVGNFEVRINSINIRDKEYEASIDLTNYYQDLDNNEQYSENLENIELAFESRLAYKATVLPKNLIVDFSDRILQDSTLMSYYEPVYLEEPAKYSANIITSSFKDGNIYAIVEEDFIGKTKDENIHMNTDHRVIYDTNSKKIIFDEIIGENEIE